HREVGRLAAGDDLRADDALHADVHGAGVADLPDRDAVGAVLPAAVDGAAGDDVRVLHDPAAGRAARQRDAGAADEYADFPGEPADPLRGVPAGDGLAPAAPPVPDGAALPAEGAAQPPAGGGRVPRTGDGRGGLFLSPAAAAAPDGGGADGKV